MCVVYSYVIGRSMTECHKISPRWVSKIAELADEVWVPSRHSYRGFQGSGVPTEKMVIIPESIDPSLYDPFKATPMKYDLMRILIPNACLPALDLMYGVLCLLCVVYRLAGMRQYNFLSVFKFEPRKGWDILLQAFFQEFSEHDNVTLFLHTYLYGSHMPRNRNAIMAKIT